MRIRVVSSNAVLVCSLLLLPSVSMLPAQAADSMSKKADRQSSTVKPSATGSVPAGQRQDAKATKPVDDKLQACLSRIPKDSSAGQRLLAEQGCRSEQQVRSSSHAAPEF